jgi:hypothetical protein
VFDVDGQAKTVGVPAFPAADFRIPIAIGRLDGDTIDDIVAIGVDPEGHGTLYGWASAAPAFETALPRDPIMGCDVGGEAVMPAVYLRDLNGDGRDEIHYYPGPHQSITRHYYYVYNPDGSPWAHPYPPFFHRWKHCLPADLDGDGICEIYAYGTVLTEFNNAFVSVRDIAVEIDGAPMLYCDMSLSAVDLDADGTDELIVFGKGDQQGGSGRYHVFAFDAGLTPVEGWPHDTHIDPFFVPTHPVFGDIDGDGELEYVISYWNDRDGLIVVNDLQGQPLSADPTGLFAVSAQPGAFVLPILADLTGDFRPDILSACVTNPAAFQPEHMYPLDRLVCYDYQAESPSGYPLPVIGSDSAQSHAPVVGDINQDGLVDVVYAASNGRLVCINHPSLPYHPSSASCPMWRYNRSLNTTQSPYTGPIYCGDINGNGVGPDIVDLVALVGYMFKGGQAPAEGQMADLNGDGQLDVADLVYLVNYMFKAGPDPACPHKPDR